MNRTPHRELVTSLISLTLALSLAGCGDDDHHAAPAAATPTHSLTATATRTSTPLPTSTPTPSLTPIPSCQDPAVQASEPLCALDTAAVPCEFINTGHCLLPYPSSYFLATDASTPTRYKVNFARASMPANVRGIHINPTEWNTLDGFSPGTVILALFPSGVDLSASNTALITDIGHSLDADSPTVLVDAETGEHILHFVEMDAQATATETRALIIRPGKRLQNAHRYLVGLRNLKDLAGGAIAATRPFQILRDGQTSPVAAINARRAHFEDIFSRLTNANVPRSNLILAWDFVTASDEAITGRMLSMRDQGLAANGPGAPAFTVDMVEDNPSPEIARRVTGKFTVPLYMNSATPPAVYNLDANGKPLQNGTTQATFVANIPPSAVAGADAPLARPITYGHGLLGAPDEVSAHNLRLLSSRYNFVIAGTHWVGLSEDDVNNTLRIIGDFSNFNQLADRLQQAFLNFILLGRLMTSADGLNSHPAFQVNGRGVIDTQEIYYYGNSQGGIEGGAVLALSPDVKRGVLGVGAANYSTLLQRSIDFNPFGFVVNQSYPNDLDRVLGFPLIQQLWDRGEPNGYMHRILQNPFPGSPVKKLIMQTGVNDSQVSSVAAGIQARSFGIPALAPTTYPLFGVPEMAAPFDGSAFIPYDVGGSPPPEGNQPPAEDNGVHEAVRLLDAAQAQIDAFLRPNGRIENFCTGPNGACAFTNVPDVH